MRYIEVPAIEYMQGKKDAHSLYTFVVNGKSISEFASVSRVKRDSSASLFGYQRPEVINHIKEIRNYIEESDNPMIPNAIVVAFSPEVQFFPNGPITATSKCGTLRIPLGDIESSQPKVGWIVDGQQRTAAIRDAQVDIFPICVVGFIARDESEQREHFVRVNSAKPLPKDLIFELLPETDSVLAKHLMAKKEPARIAGRLNGLPHSPFYNKIKTPTSPRGIISYSAVLRMLENSLRDGVLYEAITLKGGEDGEKEVIDILCDYWGAVADLFPDPWKLPPAKSRLTHGCGLLAMGYLMDEISHYIENEGDRRRLYFRNELSLISGTMSWSRGEWNFGQDRKRAWNELQNTHSDIAMLSNFLILAYRSRKKRSS